MGALIGSAIDGTDGDDSAVDGAIIGAATAAFARMVLPVLFTYAVGWAVLKALSTAEDAAFGSDED